MIGAGHQGVFLAEEGAVLADQRQAVHVGIHGDAEIGLLLRYGRTEVGEVGRQRLRVMCELAIGRAVHLHHLGHAQGLQQLGHGDAAHGVHGIHGHLESTGPDGLHIHQVQCKDGRDVLVGPAFIHAHSAQVIHRCEGKLLALRQAEHFGPQLRADELPLGVEQLQGIPLLGVVAGGEDDAGIGFLPGHGHLGGGGGGQPEVDHFKAEADQRAAHQVGHHGAAGAGIAAHHHLGAVLCRLLLHDLAEGGGVAHHIDR